MSLDSPPLRILVLADDPLARAGLAAVLAEDPDFQVVDQTALQSEPGSAAWDELDLVVADLGWEPAPSLAALGALDLDTPTVLLMPGDEPPRVPPSHQPRGLLPRDVSPSRLRAAAVAVAAGWLVLDPSHVGLVTDRDLGHAEAADLTPRELDVLRLVAEGLPNKAIAHELGISEHTVKYHVDGILSKLDAQSRTEAAVRAARLGLIAV